MNLYIGRSVVNYSSAQQDFSVLLCTLVINPGFLYKHKERRTKYNFSGKKNVLYLGQARKAESLSTISHLQLLKVKGLAVYMLQGLHLGFPGHQEFRE